MTRRIVNRIQDIYSIRIKKSFILLVFLITSFSIAEAKTLYVNGTTGSDNTTYANNDIGHPWATLSRAVWGSTSRTSPNASQAAAAGDTVLVAAGTYHNGNATGQARVPTLQPANSGTLGSPITFKCVTAGACILTHTGTGSYSGGPILGSQSTSYHTWDGFKINTINAQNFDGQNPSHNAGPVISLEGCVGMTIKNFTIDSTGMTYWVGDNFTMVWVSDASNITLQNNMLKNHRSGPGTDENVSTMTTYHSQNIVYENNVAENIDTGIYIKGDVVIPNNNVIIRYNIFRNNNVGMRLQHARNVSVYQNIVYRNRFGIYMAENIDLTVYNNTIDEGVGSDTPNSIIFASGGSRAKIIKNNIITNTNGYAIVERYSDNFTSNYNDFYNYNSFATGEYTNYTFSGWKGLGYDANSITTNPQYVNQSGRDYHLSIGSPARTASDTGGPVGAYITGNELIGHSGYFTPVPPPEPTPSSWSGGGGGCSVSTTGEFGSEYRMDVVTVLILLSPALWVVSRRGLRRS